jgi:hypothetical protein
MALISIHSWPLSSTGAAGVDVVVAFCRLKRRRNPFVERIRAVARRSARSTNGRLARGVEPVSVDQRAAFGGNGFDVLSDAPEFVGHEVGRFSVGLCSCRVLMLGMRSRSSVRQEALLIAASIIDCGEIRCDLLREGAYLKYNVASSTVEGRTLLSTFDFDFLEIQFTPYKLGMVPKSRGRTGCPPQRASGRARSETSLGSAPVVTRAMMCAVMGASRIPSRSVLSQNT